jgi:hypothetical protein
MDTAKAVQVGHHPMKCLRPTCNQPRLGGGIYCAPCRKYIVLDTRCPFVSGNPHHALFLAERRRRMALRFFFDGEFVYSDTEVYA